jgi:hypothetical protein
MNEQQTLASGASPSLSRRRFIGYAGALAGAGLLAGSIVSCKKEEDPMDGAIDLGSGDTGVLNLVFAMAQLQAAFYAQVILTPYTPLKTTDAEYKLIVNMRDHEIAHRELLRKLVGGGAIADLTPNFTNVFFNKRTSVLDTARFFEDLSVAAYNGATKLLSSDVLLDVFVKIASVEARHAATIHNLIELGTFTSNQIGQDGLELASDPKDVLLPLSAYFKEKLNPANLPTS